MKRFVLDPDSTPELTPEQESRLAAMSDAEITAAAEDDPDNPPLTEAEFERIRRARRVREVRAHTGLSQSAFARRYHINVGRLRDLEQGRSQPDSAILAYLSVIDREPDAVRRALGSDDGS